ncbi:hypothetical protein DEO72_LG1g826 [Vigna unguiculata]|uniref:Uncharacterized protein n=1 Tax=Vigna unguiculata TaxID=3917 RepID=A0A4D6KTT7_VIGUN|nr:hypothetical protein DEO72_LG1g826 [Vigna unguiculata]
MSIYGHHLFHGGCVFVQRRVAFASTFSNGGDAVARVEDVVMLLVQSPLVKLFVDDGEEEQELHE